MVELVKQDFNKNKKFYFEVKKKLKNKLAENIPINQVGSTAIPDMYGKNIMDILVGAVDNDEFENIKNVLESEGFVASKKSKDEIYQFLSSTADETGSGDVHIHLVIIDTERYNEFLILRDYLLISKEEAKKYSNLKQEIIDLGTTDRREYKRIKSEYVTKLLDRAKEWKKTQYYL